MFFSLFSSYFFFIMQSSLTRTHTFHSLFCRTFSFANSCHVVAQCVEVKSFYLSIDMLELQNQSEIMQSIFKRSSVVFTIKMKCFSFRCHGISSLEKVYILNKRRKLLNEYEYIFRFSFALVNIISVGYASLAYEITKLCSKGTFEYIK